MALPAAPGPVTFTNLKDTSVTASFVDGSNGGQAITARQIWYDTVNAAQPGWDAKFVGSTNTHTISGLAKNTTYYFWARTYNGWGINDPNSGSNGWGDFSAPRSIKTYAYYTVPTAPTTPVISLVTHNSFQVTFSGNQAAGGPPILEWQVAWDTVSPTTPRWTQTYTGTSEDIVGLTPGTKYYVWARGRNLLGWGAWAVNATVTMKNVASAPSAPVISAITQNSVHVVFTDNANGGYTIDDWEVGYGTSSTAPQLTKSGKNIDLTDLDAGQKYYFWARSHNVVGWSPYSAVSSATLLAGAWVLVDNVWQRAVPYVNVDGVWKVATPWAKIAGVWKETA